MKKSIQSLFVIIVPLLVGIQSAFAQDAKQSLQSVISAYLELKNALTQDNANTVRSAAIKLYNTIDSVSADKLVSQQRKSWTQFQAKLRFDTEPMKQAISLEDQREQFAKLSVTMYNLLKEIKINTNELYYQFCSMANKGKGAYWVSEQLVLNNPYMGKSMPRCGMTKETLKAKK